MITKKDIKLLSGMVLISCGSIFFAEGLEYLSSGILTDLISLIVFLLIGLLNLSAGVIILNTLILQITNRRN